MIFDASTCIYDYYSLVNLWHPQQDGTMDITRAPAYMRLWFDYEGTCVWLSWLEYGFDNMGYASTRVRAMIAHSLTL